jgi:FixJ family two-component response regulator
MTSPLNIAIIDDHSSVLRALARVLRTEDMKCSPFANADEFLQALASGMILSPDCLVLDIHMPGMSGLELQHELRTRNDTFPVIMITADDGDQLCEEALSNGAFAVLKKPFTDEVFLRAIRNAVESVRNS